jgi:hypothetical protein
VSSFPRCLSIAKARLIRERPSFHFVVLVSSALRASSKGSLQILYGRISKKLADNQDAAGQFLLECGIDAWTAMGRAAALHEPDCKKGCNHEKFPWLWGNAAHLQSQRRAYVEECNVFRAELAREQASLLDPLEDSIPKYRPYSAAQREECVQLTLEHVKRKYQTEAGFDPTSQIRKIMRRDGPLPPSPSITTSHTHTTHNTHTRAHRAVFLSHHDFRVCMCRWNPFKVYYTDTDTDGDRARFAATATRVGREGHG